jgi:uncharacterized cupin superfamily protein
MPRADVVQVEDGEDDLGRGQTEPLGDTGGPTRSGAFIETLRPGAAASKKHWHRHEGEVMHGLEGSVARVEGGVVTVLNAGQTACFKAGAPIWRHLENCAGSPARHLAVRTRAGDDVATRADTDETVSILNGRKAYRDGAGDVTSRKSYHGVG